MSDFSDDSDRSDVDQKNDTDHDNGMEQAERIKTAASFCGLGVLLHSFFTLVVSGAQDILAGTLIPTPIILVSHVGPMVLVATVFPWCMQKFSYFARTLAVFLFMAGGSLMVIFIDNVYLKIVGVSLNAVAHGLGEISFLALGAFYGRTAVAAFAAGSGAGILFGPIYYTGECNTLIRFLSYDATQEKSNQLLAVCDHKLYSLQLIQFTTFQEC